MHTQDFKEDPSHTKEMGGKRGGIVGESQIWDGPLSQAGRLHGEGASNGIYGMKLKTAPVPLGGRGPITQIAKG
jgi:hypothetical protein|tara:strand:+ start:3004 stop:3225 length:222 start_codon:yes stop_codon:yes gene_type:complete